MSEQIRREEREFKKILKQYKATGVPYVDKNFHPNKIIQENKISCFDSIEKWERIDKVYKEPLFKKELINPDFIEQGQIGDCYLMAALSRIAQESHLIPVLFNTNIPNKILGKVEDSINIECGAVLVYFYYCGKKTGVIIDTLMPMKYDQLIFSRPSDKTKSIWFCLVEKAFAKLKGSYSNIVSGLLSTAIYSIFNYYPTNKKYDDLSSSDKIKKMSVFDRLLKYQQQNAILSCSTGDDVDNEIIKNAGLVSNHEYLIRKVRQINGNNLICLRNPWGSSKWNGDWSNISPLWNDEMRNEADFKNENNGTFWMCENDFFKYFHDFSVSKPIHPECFSRRLVTYIKPGASKVTSPTFILKFDDEIPPKEECKIYFVIERKNACIDSSAKQSIQYSILTTQKTGITIKYFTFICNSEIFTFTQKKVNTKAPIEIVFQREGDFNYVDDYYVLAFCDYNFNIFDNSNPSDFCPKEENPHIVFTNNSSKHPYIAKPIRTKTRNGKTFLDFNSSYHNTKSENERVLAFISKLGNISDSYLTTSSLSNQQEMKKIDLDSKSNNENSSYVISSTDDYHLILKK